MAELFKEINTQVHFIGIGGIGMSGIARILLARGVKVSGSDLKENRIVNELQRLGARVFAGHNAHNVEGAGVVVYSSAIKEDNPEISEARRLNIPLIKRACALAELMRDKFVITVTGSHGKTTTTSLISYLLSQSGFSPSAAIGGILRNTDNNTYFGDGKFFVAEADESDGSFLYYQPDLSVITNVDYEHLDYYHDFENELEAFKKFINRTRESGCVFCCGDDINLKNMLRDYKNRYLLFGLNEACDIYPKNILMNGLTCEFDCFYNRKFVDRFYLGLGGEHNISNALSAIAVGLELRINPAGIKKALAGYKGALRRSEVKFKNKDYLIIDDYAHHPTEIRATLAAVKNLKYRRIIAVFQPHRYTRTKLLLEEFGRAFALADYVCVTDIYAASEAPLEGISARCIYDKIKEVEPDKQAEFLPKEELVSRILRIIEPADLVITLGAGDITKICDELVEELKRQTKDR